MADVDRPTPIEAMPVVDRRARDPRDQRQEGEGERRHADTQPRSIDDVVFIMGIAQEEVTPGVHQALTSIMAEFDRVRTERDRLHEQTAYLQELADSHAFLPVINRRALLRELSRALTLGEQAETTGAFLYLDVVNLAELRAQYGQAAADQALVKAADVIRQHIRASDVVGSMDAGDFGVVLAPIDPATAVDKAREIVAAVERRIGDGSGAGRALRLRAGLHVFVPGEDARAIVAAADRAAREAPVV